MKPDSTAVFCTYPPQNAPSRGPAGGRKGLPLPIAAPSSRTRRSQQPAKREDATQAGRALSARAACTAETKRHWRCSGDGGSTRSAFRGETWSCWSKGAPLRSVRVIAEPLTVAALESAGRSNRRAGATRLRKRVTLAPRRTHDYSKVTQITTLLESSTSDAVTHRELTRAPLRSPRRSEAITRVFESTVRQLDGCFV